MAYVHGELGLENRIRKSIRTYVLLSSNSSERNHFSWLIFFYVYRCAMIELPVIQYDRSGKITSREYHKFSNFFDEIIKEYDPCWVDDNWICDRYRKSYTEWWKKTCCDEHFSSYQYKCDHLWKKWCTTNNIACKAFLCDTAFYALPKKIQKIFEAWKRDLVTILERNGSRINLYHFLSTKEFKQRIVKSFSSTKSRRSRF